MTFLTTRSTFEILTTQRVLEELNLVNLSALEGCRQLGLATVERLLCVDVGHGPLNLQEDRGVAKRRLKGKSRYLNI